MIVNGFNTKDPTSLTPRKIVDDQLNATTLNMLWLSISDEYSDLIALLKTAKEFSKSLEDMFEGYDSVQRSQLALLKQEVSLLTKHDCETADQVLEDYGLENY